MKKIGYKLGFVISTLLLLIAYWIELRYKIQPCPLCILQRGIIFFLALLFLFGAIRDNIHRPFAWTGLTLSLLGTLVAGRQIFLQYFSSNPPADCGASLMFMLEHFNLMFVARWLFEGHGACHIIDFTLLGLSLAVWSFGFFVICLISFGVLLKCIRS